MVLTSNATLLSTSAMARVTARIAPAGIAVRSEVNHQRSRLRGEAGHLRVRVVQDRRRLLADGCVRTVFDKSNDFRERLSVANVLADGIFAREIRPLKGFVHDRHWRAADPVARSKIASTQKANPHRVEITADRHC